MTLLRLISWPYFRKHVLRTLLTTAGIVLGVAVFVAMHTANQSVLYAFSQTIERIAGKTELQVTAGDTGFSEEVLDRIQAASTVKVAVPVIEAVVDSNIKGQGNLFVLGIDMTGDRSLRDYDFDSGSDGTLDDPLVFLAQPDSLILSKDFADKNRLSAGSKLQLGTADGAKAFTVRGMMKASGLASAFGGNLAVMDIYAAQKMFGRGRTFDRIDLAVKQGRSVAECQRELAGILGPAFEVQPPASRGQQAEALLVGYTTMVNMSSAFALFIGMFIVYNSFAIAVAQRRTEIGVLRALGATRGQIQALFFGESAALGVVGSGLGLALGVLIAGAIGSSVSALIGNLYGVADQAREVGTSPALLGLSLAVGLATSLVAAAIPARNAAGVDPVHALKKGSVQAISVGENRFRAVLAGVFAVVALGCLFGTQSRPAFYLGYVLAIASAVLLGPAMSLALAKAMRPVLKWLRPVEGALAADSIIRTPRRTAASVAALMLSLALVVAFSGMALASYRSIVDWMNTSLNADLFVMPSQKLEVRTTRFPAAMATEIADVPGVAQVQMFRNGRITFRGSPVMLVAIEMPRVAQTSRTKPVAGDAGDMYRKAAAGEGLIVSDSLAERQHLALGEVLDLAAPGGTIRLPIVGIVLDYTDQQGAILIDRSVFLKYWKDDSVSDFRIFMTPGAKIGEVRQRLIERYAGQRQVFVLTNQESRDYILRLTNQWFSLMNVQIAIAVLVAILGIVNTLTVSVMDRRRELGVLQAVGARHGQIRRTIWLEAMGVAAIGLVLGCTLGAVNLYYMLQVVQRDIAGMRLDYQFPAQTALALVPTILLTAFLAAIWPAEAAVRGSLVEALEYE